MSRLACNSSLLIEKIDYLLLQAEKLRYQHRYQSSKALKKAIFWVTKFMHIKKIMNATSPGEAQQSKMNNAWWTQTQYQQILKAPNRSSIIHALETIGKCLKTKVYLDCWHWKFFSPGKDFAVLKVVHVPREWKIVELNRYKNRVVGKLKILRT